MRTRSPQLPFAFTKPFRDEISRADREEHGVGLGRHSLGKVGLARAWGLWFDDKQGKREATRR